MSGAETPPRRGTPMWVKILLGASLAVNLLIIGAVSGVAFRQARDGGPEAARSGFALVAALEKPDRRAVLSSLRRSEGGGGLRGHRADLREVLALLRDDTFDAAAFEAQLRDMAARGQSAQSTVITALSARIAEMTTEERGVYAARVEAQMRHRGRKSNGR